jgi:protein O-mannosyl-transferase
MWGGVALFLFAAALYGQTVGFSYALDDNAVITSNRWVQQGLRGVWPLMTTHFFEGFFSAYASYYRPLAMVSFAVEFEFFGFDPRVSHGINVLLYASSAVALLRLIWELIKEPVVALGATALWVASPLHVEVAASIKSRDELLALLLNTVFLLLAVRFAKTGARELAGWAALAFGLALFTKESALTFLAVLPLTLFSLTRTPLKRALWTCATVVPGVLLYFAARHAVTGRLLSATNVEDEAVANNLLLAAATPAEAWATAFKFVLVYLRMLFWPDPLIWDYSIGQVTLVTWSDAAPWLGLAILVALTAALAWRLRRGDVFGWALGFCAITYAIPSNLIVRVYGSTLAERYLYPLTVGFCVLVAYGLWRLVGRKLARCAPLIGALVLAWTLRSWDRIPDWRNNDTLITSNATHGDGNPRLVGAWGSALSSRMRHAVNEDPEQIDAVEAETLEFMGRQLALVESDPHQYRYVEVEAQWVLGLNHWLQGELVEALPYFQRVVELEPKRAQAWWFIGFIEYDSGHWPQAVEAYEEAVQMRPKTGVVPGDDVLLQDYYMNLSLAYDKVGRTEDALDAADEALEWQPNYAKAQLMRATMLAQLGRGEEAQEAYEAAVALDPDLRAP